MKKKPKRASVMTFDLFQLAAPIDRLVAERQESDQATTRANVVRDLLTKALRAEGVLK